MGIIVLKYVQLVCITLFMNNVECAREMMDLRDMGNLKVVACVADCLKTSENYHPNLKLCYELCSNETTALVDVTAMDETFNASFSLHCRDSSRLIIQVDIDDAQIGNETFIYLVTVQQSDSSLPDRITVMSDEPLIELRDLNSSESYNISASIVSSNYRFRDLGTQKHTTVKVDFIPGNVTHVKVERFEAIDGDGEYLNFFVEWKPAHDRTCHYDVILHSVNEGGDMKIQSAEERNGPLYAQEFYKFKYNSEYSVAVRGINKVNESYHLESHLVWTTVRTPTCWGLYNSEEFCGPTPITNVFVEDIPMGGDIFDITVSWNSTEHLPEYYLLDIVDDSPRSQYERTGIENLRIDKNETSFLVPSIKIRGSSIEVILYAYSNGHYELFQKFHALKDRVYIPDDQSSLHAFFYSFMVAVVVAFIVLFRFWQTRLLHKGLSPKQLESMDLDLIKSISNRSLLEAIESLTRDALMEVERENINLMEDLGEGAFGLVRKGILMKNGKKQLIAVKMLKSSSNIDDKKQFHREILVMKSVGPHANIVSIIGHCTSNIHELMLLTEFCDAGNLLDFLRREKEVQTSYFDRKLNCTPPLTIQKHDDSEFNFDDDEKKIAHKSFECSSHLFVVNQLYDDLNNNEIEFNKHNHQQPTLQVTTEMTATNVLYLEQSAFDPPPVVIEISEVEDPVNFLSSSDLVSFAKQVADGMDFLAKKKIVHRDLAARNILVCSDRTVKIADFGLSRDIYKDDVYHKVGNGKLPIKWLAIESMTHQEYTSQSDVWSFGVLLYEIVTFGNAPYPGLTVDETIEKLKSGKRMKKPLHCHDELYKVMESCWEASPQKRPKFEDLSKTLQCFLKLESLHQEQFIDLQKLFTKSAIDLNYLKPIA